MKRFKSGGDGLFLGSGMAGGRRRTTEDDGGRPDSGFGWRFLGRHEHSDECSWGVREKWGGFLFVFFLDL